MKLKGNPFDRSHQLERRWQRLSARYLPLTFAGSKWRYSRSLTRDDPDQGWKLHITGTVLTANEILSSVGPLLCRRGVLFKAPTTLLDLVSINAGVYSEFSQVGKFLTVYPRSSEEAVLLAAKLDQLVSPLRGPTIPFDVQLHTNSSIYYRYGSFKSSKTKHRNGPQPAAVRNDKGRLVADRREPGYAVPKWLDDPFIALRRAKNRAAVPSPLGKAILAYEALSQRGKGGVYRALDVSVSPPRRCVLKEGRKNGETNWDGRDGYWRVKHEDQVLSFLSTKCVPVPKVLSRFKVERNYYLVMEYVEGKSLQSLLDGKREFGVPKAIEFGLKLARLLARIHGAGWVWRDCKPMNIIVSPSGSLVPIDFEGACRVDRPDPMPWGTPGYVPGDRVETVGKVNRLPEDLYALGAVLLQLFTRRTPSVTPPRLPIKNLGRGIPPVVTSVISSLLDPDENVRPAASDVAQLLEGV